MGIEASSSAHRWARAQRRGAYGCAILVEAVKNDWKGPTAFKVFLVGNQDDSEVQSVFSAFQREADRSQLSINDVPIRFETKNDHGAADTAKAIAEELLKVDLI